VNRFECRTCPYQYILDRDFFERTDMKQKEVEDVFGGKEEFKNADTIASESPFDQLVTRFWSRLTPAFPFSSMSSGGLQRGPGVLLPAADP